MTARAVQWLRCQDPCGFEGKLCRCGKPHTHYRRLPGCIQYLWPVACDDCVPRP